MPARCLGWGLVVAISLFLSSCGGGSSPANPTVANPTSPSPPTPPPPGAGGGACRQLGSVGSYTITAGGTVVMNVTRRCNYNTPSNELTCTQESADANGAKTTDESVVTYGSVSDFVSEVAVIPGRGRGLSGRTTVVHPSGTVNSTQTMIYDSQNRILSVTSTASGVSVTLNYSAWDSAGRPTRWTDSVSQRTTTATHDDATRTTTITAIEGVSRVTFDVNGNMLVAVSPTGTQQHTYTATQTVCP